jgi:hypothetical protein
MTIQSNRYCELCDRDEKCHCPRMQGYCRICCPPPVAPMSDYARAEGLVPEPVRMRLVRSA